MTAIPEKRPPKAGCHEKSTKEKTLESGSGFLPSVSRKQLVRSIREEKDPVARDRMLACLHRKDGCSIRSICKIMVRPYSTIRDWLWRMQDGGIRCRHDKERGRRGCKIPKKVFRAVKRWVKKEPKDFKFESGSWQLNLLLEMIRRHFGLECNARTLRRWLRRIRLSWRKSRHVPYRTASKTVQMEFKEKAGGQARLMRAAGCAVFAEDEAAVQMQQNPKYGWRPTGGRETSKTTFSTRSIRMFGAMSKDRLIISIVDSTNSETFQEFLEGIRRDHPKFYMVLDNVSYHKSKAIQKYVESAGDDIAFEFLPPYTPQLNPIETAWRDLKRRLAGRYFKSTDELKHAITTIVECEMGNRLKGYLAA